VESAAVRAAPRPGRWWVRLALGLALPALVYGIVDLSTQKPARNRITVSGLEESQQVFGGVEQQGDRLGAASAPVAIQLFTDMQCSNCRSQFLSTVPSLVQGDVRDGKLKLELRHYSVSESPEELGFFGAEAAARQGYGWQYTYLFFHNQGEAKRLSVDEDFLQSIASSIPELQLGDWEHALTVGLNSDSGMRKRLDSYDQIGTDLSIRARPAAIVSGPNGTRTLQDGPSLGQIEAAIAAVD
jgi:protein-disulfide isomerase